jgi:hypothetical protein
VNDEFIDVHMSAEAARAAGQPDIFGMGNLRIAYVHDALFDWLAGAGDIAEFGCQFRALNMKGDAAHARGDFGTETRDGGPLALRARRPNQRREHDAGHGDVRSSWARARVPRLCGDAIPTDRVPAVHLDAAMIGWLGAPAPDHAYAVGANDIRRWAIATWYPDEAPAEWLDDDIAARGPWGGLVAPRDFNPFAWTRCTPPDTYPWMRGMGSEPGRRGLNGGQRNRYFAPIRPGDAITQGSRWSTPTRSRAGSA